MTNLLTKKMSAIPSIKIPWSATDLRQGWKRQLPHGRVLRGRAARRPCGTRGPRSAATAGLAVGDHSGQPAFALLSWGFGGRGPLRNCWAKGRPTHGNEEYPNLPNGKQAPLPRRGVECLR